MRPEPSWRAYELVPEDEFAARLHVGREWIAGALADRRLFFFLGPDEVKYFPAFYADTTLHRGELEAVCRKLGYLESASKYHFFTSKSTFLLTKSPLEALRDGMLTKVLMAAGGLPSSWPTPANRARRWQVFFIELQLSGTRPGYAHHDSFTRHFGQYWALM